jgi:probable addiction module antidote protein
LGKISTRPFDAAKFIIEPEDVIDFLNDALESGHAPYVASVLGDIARSEGMTKLASKTGINRQALYSALSENGNPTLDTLLRAFSALGIRLKCENSIKAA